MDERLFTVVMEPRQIRIENIAESKGEVGDEP
jgi:hypothetical protein